jgi:hypothetical protein
MIKEILLQNRMGKTRLSRWYLPYDDAEKNKICEDVHRIVSSRDPKFANFVEFGTGKIIYR